MHEVLQHVRKDRDFFLRYVFRFIEEIAVESQQMGVLAPVTDVQIARGGGFMGFAVSVNGGNLPKSVH